MRASKVAMDSSSTTLLIAVTLTIIIFIVVLHLLVRCLLTPISIDEPDDPSNITIFQGQLRQLFNIHDSGLDQCFIDTLPVFLYKAIIGLKHPLDCAICLSEFEPNHKLRLLPNCSHAFHLDCIDTWLLSHSTCPLCRSSLVQVLESASESETEIDTEEVETKDEKETECMVQVKLGKFRNIVDVASNDLDERRCFSMGSYEYVMNDVTCLHVAIMPSKKKESFSVSRIWMRLDKGKSAKVDGSSFRLPSWKHEPSGKDKISVASEFEVSEMDLDVEIGSCNDRVVSLKT